MEYNPLILQSFEEFLTRIKSPLVLGDIEYLPKEILHEVHVKSEVGLKFYSNYVKFLNKQYFRKYNSIGKNLADAVQKELEILTEEFLK